MQKAKNKLKINNIACSYDQWEIFSDVSFEVQSGEVLQITGGNGSGKTTLLRTIAGLKWLHRGSILWNETLISEIKEEYKENISFIGHLNGIKQELTALENLSFASCISTSTDKISPIDALRMIGLTGLENELCYTLSVGQCRRIALARLIITKAALWILDEPFTAIDYKGKKYIEKIIEDHIDNGGIAIISTHNDININKRKIKVLDLGETS